MTGTTLPAPPPISTMSADDELSGVLGRRNDINEGRVAPSFNKKIPITAEFKEFSLKEIQSKSELSGKIESKVGKNQTTDEPILK